MLDAWVVGRVPRLEPKLSSSCQVRSDTHHSRPSQPCRTIPGLRVAHPASAQARQASDLTGAGPSLSLSWCNPHCLCLAL